jgi:hypothetical protein
MFAATIGKTQRTVARGGLECEQTLTNEILAEMSVNIKAENYRCKELSCLAPAAERFSPRPGALQRHSRSCSRLIQLFSPASNRTTLHRSSFGMRSCYLQLIARSEYSFDGHGDASNATHLAV